MVVVTLAGDKVVDIMVYLKMDIKCNIVVGSMEDIKEFDMVTV